MSDLVKRLHAYRESATLFEGEYNELSAIIKSVEALEGENAALVEAHDLSREKWAALVQKEQARAERLLAVLVTIHDITNDPPVYERARKALEDDKQ